MGRSNAGHAPGAIEKRPGSARQNRTTSDVSSYTPEGA
jgi:hypothetical protein